MSVFIIEHLEPNVYQWCILEYRHISQVVGKENLWFTNTNSSRLAKFGKVIPESVTTMNLRNACLLDISAPVLLEPKEAKMFDYYIFGGILGDLPAQGRTKRMLTDKINWAELRNLGKDQFSTDTAILVAKKIINGTPLQKIKFIDQLEVHTKLGESVILPYKYVVENDKPVVAPGLVEMLTAQKGF